jgi:hypothetical protein
MTSRNRTRSLLLFGCLSLAACILLAAPARAQACDYTTITPGDYAFHGHGFSNHGQAEFPVPAGPALPVAIQGNITFNGDGTVSGKQRAAVGGQIGPGATFTGNYTLNNDCSFTVTRVLPCGCQVQWRIEIVNGEAELLFLYLEPGVTLEGSIIKR